METAAHVQEAARKSESVDLVGVDNFNCERHFSIGMTNQILSNSIHVLCDHRIPNQVYAVFYRLRVLLANTYFVLQRIPVAQAPSSHLTVADSLYVIFAASVFRPSNLVSLRGVGIVYLRY